MIIFKVLKVEIFEVYKNTIDKIERNYYGGEYINLQRQINKFNNKFIRVVINYTRFVILIN